MFCLRHHTNIPWNYRHVFAHFSWPHRYRHKSLNKPVTKVTTIHFTPEWSSPPVMIPKGNEHTRGHQRNFFIRGARLNLRKNFFTVRVGQVWNKLPGEVIMAKDVNSFKRLLDEHGEDHPADAIMTHDHRPIWAISLIDLPRSGHRDSLRSLVQKSAGLNWTITIIELRLMLFYVEHN